MNLNFIHVRMRILNTFLCGNKGAIFSSLDCIVFLKQNTHVCLIFN
jgi:hypothetical protein